MASSISPDTVPPQAIAGARSVTGAAVGAGRDGNGACVDGGCVLGAWVAGGRVDSEFEADGWVDDDRDGITVTGTPLVGVEVVGVELDGGLVGPAGQFCSISSAPEAQSSSPSQRRLASMHRPSQANAPSMHTASVVGAVFGDVRSIEVLGHQRKLSCHDNFTMCVMFDSMYVRTNI